MKLLVIGGKLIAKETYVNVLSKITDENSIIFINSSALGKEFIISNLMPNQLEIDLIIIEKDFNGKNLSGKEFAIFIRSLSDETTFYNEDFKLNSIPMILVDENSRIIQEHYEERLFNKILTEYQIKNGLIYDIIRKVIKDWRELIHSDFELLKIDQNPFLGNFNFDNNLFSMVGGTKVISKHFLRKESKIKYLWAQRNFNIIENRIIEFGKLLKDSFRTKKRNEKEFHTFFNENKHLLLREAYEYFIYEAKFYYNDSKKHIEPDYIMKPKIPYYSDFEVLEVKLPNEKLVKKNLFHQNLRSKFFEYIGQVKDYEEYFQETDNLDQIIKNLKSGPHKFSYNLLIGRSKEKEEYSDILSKRLKQFNSDYIRIISYDDLIMMQERMLENLKKMKV